MATYLNHVTTANPLFNKIKDSSLDPLNNLLRVAPPGGANPAQRQAILELLGMIPHDKQQKYANALNYAVQHLNLRVPGIPYGYPIVTRHRLHEYQVAEAVWNHDQSRRPDGWFRHIMKLEWRSSNGLLQSLAGIWNRERITYMQHPIGPPHRPVIMQNTPQTFMWPPVPTQSSNLGWGNDDHLFMHPSLMVVYPLVAGVLNAHQEYIYSPDQGQTWYDMPGGQFLVDRGVRPPLNGGLPDPLVFFFCKRNNPQFNLSVPFHFEVEYIIGPAPQIPPQTYNEVQGALTGPSAQLAAHARIIAGG
jgi:hypothetical protein